LNGALVREGTGDEDLMEDEPTTIGRAATPHGEPANDTFECDTAEHELPPDHPAMRESSRLFRMDALRAAVSAPPAPSMGARRALEMRRPLTTYGLHTKPSPACEDEEPTFNQAQAHPSGAPWSSGAAARDPGGATKATDEMPTVQGTYVAEESPAPDFAAALNTPACGSPAVLDAWQFEPAPSPRRAGLVTQARDEVSAALRTLGIPRAALGFAAAMTTVLAATGAWTVANRPGATTTEGPAPHEAAATGAFALAPEAALLAGDAAAPGAAVPAASPPADPGVAAPSSLPVDDSATASAIEGVDGELNRRLLSFLRPRALRALRHGKNVRAAELGRRWVTLEPKSAAAHQFMARVSLKQRRTTDAVRWAEKAASLRPKRGPILETLGDAYLRAHRTAEAKDAYRRAARAGLRSAKRKLRGLRHHAT
jgi:hypothetical protein